MRHLRFRYGTAAFLALCIASVNSPALAQEQKQNDAQEAGQSALPVPDLLFARGGSLWRVPLPPLPKKWARPAPGAADKPEPVELVITGSREITRITASASGELVVIETPDSVKWAPLPADGRAPKAATGGTTASDSTPSPRPAASLACTGRAYLSPDGKCVACFDGSGKVVLHRLLPSLRTVVHSVATSQHLGFLDRERLVTSDDTGVWAVPIRKGGERTLLAPETPSGAMLVSPDGSRAMGVFTEGDSTDSDSQKTALYVFRLDGKGVKRRLLEGAVPLGWSRDSKWAMAQAGNRACMFKATGGQYKCWRGYRAIALAPDGSYLIMTKAIDDKPDSEPDRYDLYRGRREGVRPGSPKIITGRVTGPAVRL